MNKEKILDKLGEIIESLDGVAGRLTVMAIKDGTVKEAHQMVLDASIALGKICDELYE